MKKIEEMKEDKSNKDKQIAAIHKSTEKTEDAIDKVGKKQGEASDEVPKVRSLKGYWEG